MAHATGILQSREKRGLIPYIWGIGGSSGTNPTDSSGKALWGQFCNHSQGSFLPWFQLGAEGSGRVLRFDDKYLDMLWDRIHWKNTEHTEKQIWIYPTLSTPHTDLWICALMHPIPCSTCHSYLICFHHLQDNKCYPVFCSSWWPCRTALSGKRTTTCCF